MNPVRGESHKEGEQMSVVDRIHWAVIAASIIYITAHLIAYWVSA